MAKTTPSRSTYQLKVTLMDLKPPIWRRVLVSSNISLDQLHLVLQCSMGWTNSHLHQYIANGKFYGILDDDFGIDMAIENEDDYKVSQLLKAEKDTIKYEYDFGDGWMHEILLEKILAVDESLKLPVCIEGKRACPPEDCGGIWGYMDLLNTVNNPADPEHESILEWLGGNFDPEVFAIEDSNKMLKKYIRL